MPLSEYDDCEVGGNEGGCKTTFEKCVPAIFWTIVWLLKFVTPSVLILGGDFFKGVVLATALVTLVLRFDALTSDSTASKLLRAEIMLIMTFIIRVGQSKFVTVPIDEDSA
ncbi:hypothetical protein PILCRDRAFT_14665 [Piloderma croceum F 1598]|uniref:Uncharacterized protein n=1 Tax=Piloderma croceum (strain F 1598) TaxID=765440 RepID=A0A0C3ENG8_PILCF|nr:hypothetical protein PILCRDRAFT_14665 [Piloderma croceum F 1598]